MTAWFDPETDLLRLDEIAAGSPIFQTIMADGVVSDKEFIDINHRVLNLLRQLQDVLSPEQHILVTETLKEMTVLYAVAQHRKLQNSPVWVNVQRGV